MFDYLANPSRFTRLSDRLFMPVSIITVICLGYGLYLGLFASPADYQQGDTVRIIYIHVPAAVVALAAYYAMAIAGAIAIIWRMKVADMVLRSIAPVGAVLTFIALFTGAIWGKPTWGTYWVWQDARLTSMLILFFLYLGIIALYDAFNGSASGQRAAAIMSLVGTVNIPIIYKSVDWWSSLHQPASIKFTEESTIALEMFQPLMVAIPGFYLFCLAAVMLNMKVQIAHHARNNSWMIERAKIDS